ALAEYDHPFFGRFAALTENRFGDSTLTYEGTVLSDKLQAAVVLGVLRAAGVTGPDQSLPAPVRVRHGVNGRGRKLHYYLNYSSEAQTFSYPYGAAVDLLAPADVGRGQAVSLNPWDLAILEEK